MVNDEESKDGKPKLKPYQIWDKYYLKAQEDVQ